MFALITDVPDASISVKLTQHAKRYMHNMFKTSYLAQYLALMVKHLAVRCTCR